MSLKKYRDLFKFIFAIVFIWLYIPHILVYLLSKKRKDIDKDISENRYKCNITINKFGHFVYLMHNDSYFRTIFYHRMGLTSLLYYWWRPGCSTFFISKTCVIGGGIIFIHPYSSIINAESVGENFTIRHLCTIGNKGGNTKRPIIGDNVTLGANVTIIGEISIGNNVVIGAGTVITKTIPSNCTVVGNPAKIIRQNGKK